MKIPVAFAAILLAVGLVPVSAPDASAAVVYCQYIDYPVGCIVRPGVVLRPRPVARAAVRTGVRVNRINRIGRR